MARKSKQCSIAVDSDGRIYGAGSSARSARRNAREWADNTADLEVFPATASLCRFLKKEGYVESRVRYPQSRGGKYGLRRRSR